MDLAQVSIPASWGSYEQALSVYYVQYREKSRISWEMKKRGRESES